jgi:hypothetical protein
MENKRNFSEVEFVKNFVATYKANGGDADSLAKRTVGNNGYSLGQQFTLKGEIVVKENEINGMKQTYLVLPTEEGTELSLMSLMGVSSLRGYEMTNEIEVQYLDGTNTLTRKVKTEVIDGFKFEDVFKPASRNFLEFAGMIAEKEIDLKGKIATFLGTAVKPITAKKDSDGKSIEKFKKGFSRAIETKLWSII